MTSATNKRTIVSLQDLVESGSLHDAVPPIYVRPPHERPACAALPPYLSGQSPASLQSSSSCIPVIDLTSLHDPDQDAVIRSTLIQELGRACKEWGFFQVVNHGVETSVIQGMRDAALKFFRQPADERRRVFSQGIKMIKGVRYTTSFNPAQETVREWKDTLSFYQYPNICNGFQHAPDICKKEAQKYIGEVGALATSVYRAIFESLGLDKKYVEEELPAIPRTIMNLNYYPPCPDPTLTLGLSPHSDVSSITVLHPGDVPGLQIKHQNNWVPVYPVDPTAFIINVSDQIEILTNGKYKSVEHRAVTNAVKPRVSVACFFGPVEDTIVAPVPKLINERSPPLYKPTKFKDYFDNFMKNKLQANRGTLDFARV